GDFSWGLASRVKKDFSVRIGAALISSYSSYNPTGTCDLYMMCQNSTITSSFPNLKSDDAIQSAPASNNYNCASWGGGKVDLGRYFWASNPPTSSNLSSPWYVSGNFWQSWDNFFGNNPSRFTGAPDYTRSGANSLNGEVAMWYNSTSYQYTHFSVTKPANDQPHGYDWESKPGGLKRTFHPKDALNDNSYYGYGQISLYYIRENTALKSYSLEESVSLGLTVLQDVKLNNEEKEQLKLLKAEIPVEASNKFKEKLNRLYSKANSPEILKHSNPFFLYETAEFSEMIDFCNAQGETVWPLLFENIFFSDNREIEDLSVLILNEVTPDYGHLMEEVKEEWNTNNYTQEGAYIAPSPVANTKNYAKKLLSLKSGSESISADDEFRLDNHELFSVFPNPFKYQTNIKFNVIVDNSNVTLKVFDINGKLVESVFTNANYSTGSHETNWSANNCEPGLYFFNLTINGKSMNRRFLIE
ncbi:MAG: T9SS type A sorting domain-containing protein, partial [bacterium]